MLQMSKWTELGVGNAWIRDKYETVLIKDPSDCDSPQNGRLSRPLEPTLLQLIQTNDHHWHPIDNTSGLRQQIYYT